MSSSPILDGCPYVPLDSYNWLPNTGHHPGCDRSLPLNITVYCIFTAMHAVTVWTALGLILSAIWTFKRRNTLCFWSLIATCTGIILITIGFDISMFANTKGPPNVLFVTIMNLGRVLMVSGFSLTLYSRVNLVLFNQKTLRLLLIIIIATSIIGHVPAIVVAYLPLDAKALRADVITSKFKIIFYLQEIFLSSLYSVLFFKFVSPINAYNEQGRIDKPARWIFFGLIVGQITVLVCDITSIVMLFLDLYLARKLILPFNYALKLLIEFLVLNQLAWFSCNQARSLQMRDIEGDVKGKIHATGQPVESYHGSHRQQDPEWMLD